MRSIVLAAITALSIGCNGQSSNISIPSTGASSPSSDAAIPSGEAPDSSTIASNEQSESAATTTTPAEESVTAAPTSEASPSATEGPSTGTGTQVSISAGVATLIPENTRIQFVGTHAGAKPDPRTGVFTKFAGKAEVDLENKTLKSVSVEIKTESLETSIPKLTNHLRSPDFFDTRENPIAKFQSSSIELVEGGSDRKLNPRAIRHLHR